MVIELNGKVIALPSAQTDLGGKLVDLLLEGEHRLALGASPAQFHALDVRIDGRENAYCQPIELDRPNSVKTFFHIAFAQFGKVDVIVYEAPPSRGRRLMPERAIELAARRLLHCLDAVLPYTGNELHVVSIDAAYGLAAIPITRAFLAAKLTATGKTLATRIRISVVCPSTKASTNDVSFAKTLVHIINEPQCPDITESVLMPRRKSRSRQAAAISVAVAKINVSIQ